MPDLPCMTFYPILPNLFTSGLYFCYLVKVPWEVGHTNSYKHSTGARKKPSRIFMGSNNKRHIIFVHASLYGMPSVLSVVHDSRLADMAWNCFLEYLENGTFKCKIYLWIGLAHELCGLHAIRCVNNQWSDAVGDFSYLYTHCTSTWNHVSALLKYVWIYVNVVCLPPWYE